MSISDIQAAFDIHREAKKIGWRQGFVTACVELARMRQSSARDALALLEGAGITRDEALDTRDSDDVMDRETVETIYESQD